MSIDAPRRKWKGDLGLSRVTNVNVNTVIAVINNDARRVAWVAQWKSYIRGKYLRFIGVLVDSSKRSTFPAYREVSIGRDYNLDNKYVQARSVNVK